MSSTSSESALRTDSSVSTPLTVDETNVETQIAKSSSDPQQLLEHVDKSGTVKDVLVDESPEPNANATTKEAQVSKEVISRVQLGAFLEAILGGGAEDKESEYGLADKLNDVLMHPTIAESLDTRKKISRRRNLQALSYFASLEETVRSLEARLKVMERGKRSFKKGPNDDASEDEEEGNSSSREATGKAKAEDSEDDDDVDDVVETDKNKKSSSKVSYLLEPVFVPWNRFVLPTDEERKLPKYLIEVCVEPPRSLAETIRTPSKEALIIAKQENLPLPGSSPIIMHWDSNDNDYAKIERIRLQSKSVSALMTRILGLDPERPVLSCLSHIRPFKAFFLAQAELRRRNEELLQGPPSSTEESEEDRDLREHLPCVLNFLDTTMKELLERFEHFQATEQTMRSFKIKFNELWYLFQPGRVIYDPREHQAYLVMATRGGRPLLRTTKDGYDSEEVTSVHASSQAVTGTLNAFLISAIRLGYNGKEVGPVQRDISITPFEGMKQITDIKVYPIEYGSTHPGKNRSPEEGTPRSATPLKTVLEERGKKFIELAAQSKPCHREYNGFTLGEVREQVESQIIVDFDCYYKTKPEGLPDYGIGEPLIADPRETQDTFRSTCHCTPDCTSDEYDVWNDIRIDDTNTKKFKDDNLPLFRWNAYQDTLKQKYAFLLPRLVYGFALHSRSWSALDIDCISEIKMNPRGFEQLVLPQKHKKIVEAVVRTHSVGAKPVDGVLSDKDARAADDLVRGKGKGIIMLLHGVPGVGKTSTAETIATLTGRPLFSLTCGDIGDDAEQVQKNLEENFRLAHRWGCVMLLDEADVFLQQRSGDMKRNAIVSVFLRVLEYYSGILFLTTNKVGTFDEAFKSRIHVPLYYKELDKEQSIQIWTNNLQRIQTNRPTMEVDVAELIEWVKEEWIASKKAAKKKKMPHRPWNGRQIHNACQTAAALAEFENSTRKMKGSAKLTTANLSAVADATKEFDAYLLATHGKDESSRAEERFDRGDDAFNTPMARKKKKVQEPTPEPEQADDDEDVTDDED